MNPPGPDKARELIDWQCERGIISVFVDFNPMDRGEPWRIELRDGLDAVIANDRSKECKATVKRLTDRFRDAREWHASGRYAIGYIEVAVEPGREAWFEFQAPAVTPAVIHDHVPHLSPLLRVIDQAPLVGIAAVSARCVELYEWRFGVVEHVVALDIEQDTDIDRLEHATPASDPARGTHASASGRDQFAHHREAQQDHFLEHAGETVANEAAGRHWAHVVCFGEERHRRTFADRHSVRGRFLHGGNQNLVGHVLHELADRASGAIDKIGQVREKAVVERAKAEALTRDGHGVLGVQATIDCLLEGRVNHLLYDSRRDFHGEFVDGHLTYVPRNDRAHRQAPTALNDRILSAALAHGAKVTPLEGEPADVLAEFDGMAALLRY